MNLITTLQDLADRLGLRMLPLRTTDGQPNRLFLAIAGLASLALWTIIGWGVWRLVAWLCRL